MRIQYDNHSHFSTTLIICVVSIISFCCSTTFAGNNDIAIVQFLPVEPLNGTSYPPHVKIEGNKFILEGGPARLWFNLYISNWSAFGLIIHAQMTLDVNSYSNESGIDLTLPQEDCTSHDDCAALLGPGSQCPDYLAGAAPNFCGEGCCRPGFFDREKLNWKDADCNLSPLGAFNVNTAVKWFVWGRISGIGPYPKADCGDLYYFGTFVVDVPVNAFGTYNIDFDLSNSSMTATPDNPLAFEYIAPSIEIPLVQCCDPNLNCVADGITISQCHNIDPDNFYQLNKTCADACVCPSGDRDNDGTCDFADECPLDPNKIEPGLCGCFINDALDEDDDGVPDCLQVINVPAVSEWGLVILMLSLLIMITRYFRRTPIHS